MNEPIHLTLTGTLQPDQMLTYVHLPFTVPEGVDRIQVAYAYDAMIGSDPGLTGGNTIDIGLFDPRGIHFLNTGYRGWSGSARREFVVGRKEATPGYMPGPIFAGIWHICLGAYKVADEGCHYQVNIDLYPAFDSSQVDFPERLPLDNAKTTAASADGWYAGELHCHTVNSDGDSTTEEIIQQAEALGLNFLAIMDHNNLTHQVDLNRIQSSLILIPGFEVTTYYGHWNIWGDGEWVDFRIQKPDDLAQAIAYARTQGYLISCNHPRPYGPDWEFASVEGYTCVEVWNGPWELSNTACLAFWEARLKRGERLSAVGGSDHHFSHEPHIAQLAHPTTVVYIPPDVPPTARSVLNAIRAGHCFVTEAPDGARLTLRAGSAMMGDSLPRPDDDRLTLELTVRNGTGGRLQIITASGVIGETDITGNAVEWSQDVRLDNSPYVRIQLVDAHYGQVRALTNPIYFD